MSMFNPVRTSVRGIAGCMFLALSFLKLSAQSITNYGFSASSSTFTTISGANYPTLQGTADDGYYNGIPIGFDFWYMGARYSTVSASTNGWLTFGANITDPVYLNSLSGGGAPRPVLAPLWDDLDIQASTNVSYVTTGTAPNRICIIQYLNAQWDYQASGNTISFQIKLYETTGKVEFTYRQESGSLNNTSASIGISATATGSGNYLSVKNSGTSTNSSTDNNVTSKPVTGNRYIFTPPTPAAPGSLTFSSVGATGMTLNWSDLSSNERGFLIYQSTDGTNYAFITQTAANTTTSVQSGLTAGTTFYWKVYAVSEGGFSPALSGTQATTCSPPAAPTVTSPVNYCQYATAAPLTATGSNLLWGGFSGTAGGSTVLSSTAYVDNASNNRKTKFTTATSNIKITSVDYYIPAYQAVSGLVLSIYNSSGTVVATSTTNTTLTAGSAGARITNVFNYTISTAAEYSMGISAGTGNIGSDSPSFPITESSGTVSVTGVTTAGIRCFNNIQFTATSSAIAPTPSTDMVGSFSFPVTQTVGACVSPAATITVNVTAPDISQTPGTNMVGNYPFNGNALDVSGAGNNGTLQNSPTAAADRFGNAGKAYSFNGSTQYITTATQYVNPPNFTLSVWFKTNTTTGGKLLGFGVSQSGTSYQYDRHIYMNDAGQIYFGVYPGSVKTINSALSYNDNSWHLATATLSSTSGMALYIDGAQVANDPSVTTAESTTGYWRIGYDNMNGWTSQPSSHYFPGSLDDILIYHRALSAGEVSMLYTSPNGAGNNGPVCAGTSVTLQATTLSGASYAWSGPGGYTSTQQNPSFAYSAAASGTYTVQVTVAGCTATAYTNVTSTTNAGQWTGAVNSDWATPGNWCAGTIPDASTNVVIPGSATQMPVISAGTNCKNLTIDAGASLTTISTGTLHIGGTLVSNGTMTNSGTTDFNGTTGQQTFSGVSSFYNLTLNNSGGLLLQTPVSVANNVTLSAGTLTANNFNISVGGNWVNNASTGAFSGGTATVTFNGAAAQSIGGTFATTFSNLLISNTGNAVSLANQISVTVNLGVSSGTFDLGVYTANRATSGGSLTVSNNAILRIGGTNGFPSNYASNTLVVASTVEYAGTNQTIAANTYGNLLLGSSSGAAVKTMPGTAMTVLGNFTLQQGAGASVACTAGANMSINGNVSIGASTTFDGGSFAHNVGGNWTNNGGFNGGTSTVTFSGPGSVVSGGGGQNFHHLTVTASLVSFSAPDVQVSGNLNTSSSGSFSQVAGGAFTMTGSGKTISGSGLSLRNLNVSGSVSTSSSFEIKENIAVSGSLTASAGTISMTGAAKTISGSGTLGFSVLSIPGTVTTNSNFSIAAGLIVSGSFTASAGTATFTGTSTLSGTANLYNATINGTSLQLSSNATLGIANALTITAGTLDVASSIPNTVHFNGSGAQSINAIAYDFLNLSNGGNKTAAGNISVNNDLNIGVGTTFTGGNYTHLISKNWNNAGTFTAGAGTIQFQGIQNSFINGATAFNTLIVNNSSAAVAVILNSAVSAATVQMTQGIMYTGANTLTITSDRTGNGIIMGNILRTHAFTTGVAYAFEGPDNTVTFSAASGVNSVQVSVQKGPIDGFPYNASITREYTLTVPNGSYTATMRLHYEDDELNGNSETSMALWTFDGTYWIPVGKTANSTTGNYVEQSSLTNIAGRWTCAYSQSVVQWNGSVSSDWSTPANWTVIQGAGSTPPAADDVAVLGTAPFTHQPVVGSIVHVKNIVFGSAQAVTLSLASGSQLHSADILGIWSGNATHTINVNNELLMIHGDLSLSDGTTGHAIDLNIGTGTVEIIGTLHHKAGAQVNFTGAGNLSVTDDYHFAGGVFTPGTGTITYNGTALQAIADVNYYNLILDNPVASAIAANALSVDGNLSLVSGHLDLESTSTIAGSVTVASGAILHNEGIMHVGGDWNNDGTYMETGSTVIFDGAGTQNISASTFNNLVIDKPVGSVANLTGNAVLNGDFTVMSGTFDIHTYDCNRSVLGGTITLADSATFIVGGNNPPTNFANGSLAVSSTVIANGTIPQIIFGVDFGNLVFRNAGAKTLVSPINVHGNLVIESGAQFDAGANTMMLGGNWVNNGVFVPSLSTIICTGTSKSISGNSTFHRFSVYGSYTILGDNVFDSLLVINAGGSLSGGPSIHTTMNGDLINRGILYTLGATTFTGNVLQTLSLINAVQTVAVTVNFNGTISPVLNSTSAPQFGYLNINNTGGIYPSVGWTILYGLTVGSGAYFQGGESTHNLLGYLTNNGTITSSGTLNFVPSTAQTLQFGTGFSSTGAVVFGGSGAMTLAGAPTSFYDVTVSNSNVSGVTPSSNWLVSNDFTIQSGSAFHAGNYSHSVAGNISNNGTLYADGSTFILNGTTQQTVNSSSAFNHLTINKPAASVLLASNTTVNGTLHFDAGKIETQEYVLIQPVSGSVTGAAQSTGWVNGLMQKEIPTGAVSRTFEMGDATHYTPVSLAFSDVSTAGNLKICSVAGDHPAIGSATINATKSVNRFWRLVNTGIVCSDFAATFHFASSEVDNGVDTLALGVDVYDGSSWKLPTTTVQRATLVTATGITEFGDFAIGEICNAGTAITYPDAPYCANSGTGPVQLTGKTGGIFTASRALPIDASTGGIDLSTALPGYYVITYTIAAAGGCPQYVTDAPVTISPVPSATLFYENNPYCSSMKTAAITRLGTGGGVYSGPDSLLIDQVSGNVNLSGSPAGTYTVTYTVAAAGGCDEYTATADITITKHPFASGTYEGNPYCTNGGIAFPTGYAEGVAGQLTSTSGLTIDPLTGVIDLATSAPGVYTVTYTVPDTLGCPEYTNTATVAITEAPFATISYPAGTYCISGGTGAVTLTGVAGGTFSAAAGLSIDANSGDVYPAASTPGTYTVTYTISEADGCGPFSTTASVTIPVEGTWTGAINTNWNLVGNWLCGVVPDANMDVLIAGELPNYPLLDTGTGAVRNISILSDGSLTVSNATLQIAGDFINSGTLNAQDGTVQFNGSAPQTIPAAAFSGNLLNNLIISNVAGVSLTDALDLTGELTIMQGSLHTGGFLTLKSSADGTARVAEITSNAANPIEGEVTVERYIPGRRKYRLITSSATTSDDATLAPGNESQSIWGNWQNQGNNVQANTGTLITGGTNADGFDTGTGNPSLFTYDDANRMYVPFSSTNGKNTKYTPLKAGIAYFMFVYGDRLNSVYATSPHHTVLKEHGALLTGDQAYSSASDIPLTNLAGRYTLLGNPFASAIDWASLPKNDLAGSYWGWDPNLSNLGGYVTVNVVGDVTIIAPFSGSTGLNQYIQPGQGFFVRTTASNPSLTIREQDKVPNFNASAFLTGPAQPRNVLPLLAINLQYVNGANTVLADGVVAAFSSDFSDGVGAEDAAKLTNTAESIAILNGHDSLSIDARQAPEPNDTLFLRLRKINKPEYRFQIFGHQMDPGTTQPYLIDRYLNTSQALSVTDTNNIAFQTDASIPASYAPDRFYIVFRESTVLPVTFVNVQAAARDKQIEVSWEITAETGIRKYEVEKTTEGMPFAKCGEITAGNGVPNAHYTWLDEHPEQGDNYYRIRAVDAQGGGFYSKIVRARTGGTPSLEVYPNPVSGRFVHFKLNDLPESRITLTLLDAQGRRLQWEERTYPGGTQTFELDDHLSAGAYYLEVSAAGHSYTKIIFIH